MRNSPLNRGSLLSLWIILFLVGCSRDPNVRKQKYLESGERYFAKRQYAAAAIQFSNSVQVDSAYSAGHYQLARTYLHLQDWSKAYEQLNRTIELDPMNYEAHLDLANLLIAGGEAMQAQEHIDLLATRLPNDTRVHMAIADLYEVQENLTGATQELQKAIALDPRKGAPYLDLALIQFRTKQIGPAESSFEKAIELDPTVNARIAFGNFYESTSRFPEAEQQFRSAIEADRKNPALRAILAHLFETEGREAEAESFLRDAKSDFPDNSVGYRLLGDFYVASRKFDDAIKEYALLNQRHPQDLEVKKNFTQLLILKNRLEDARALNDIVLKKTPNDVNALIERGQIEISDGQADDAVTTLQTALKNDPENGPAYYHLGNAYERQGNLAQAEGAWRDAVRLRPNFAEARRALAIAALHKGNMAELEALSSQVIELQPTSPDGYAMRAVSRIRRGLFSQAEPDVMQAIKVAPDRSAGFVQMGNLMLAQKSYRKAEDAYREALTRESSSADALGGLIDTYLLQNRVGDAVAAARMQISKVSDNSIFYDLLGTTLFDHKQSAQDLKEAETSLEKSVHLDAHNTDAWLKLGKVEAARGAIDTAIATCERALESNPRDASFSVLIGQLNESKHRWDNAKQAYQKALEINPQHALASNNLAYLMLETGDSADLAMPLAKVAHQAMPESPQAADTLGWVFYQKGAYDSAIRLFREALKLQEKAKTPDNSALQFHLGLAYQKTGEPVLARQHLQQALKISPNDSNANDIKSLLLQLGKSQPTPAAN